jgi:peptidoglycan/LPS O-acetylase OafA/YrhL
VSAEFRLISAKGEIHRISYRPDIDGLRAIAILSVLGFHASPKFIPGGFVGVDIFFVISGFLISGMILSGLHDTTFSFGEFYGRRIRRLFPALICVLSATWVFGWFILLPEEYASLGTHMLAGAGFASNVLISSEVGYFNAPAITKPLIHLWSLGVEEQFYIFFPAILFLIWRRTTASALVLLWLAISSFALNVGLVRNYPSFTFFLPLTRLWEFLIGGALAYSYLYRTKFSLLSRFEQFHLPLGELLAAAGLLLLLVSAGLVRDRAFPGWWALLPAVGAFFLIGTGPNAWINRNILANRLLVFVGLISYPLYLWHWPLLVMGRIVDRGQHPRATTLAAFALAFVMAWLTYRFIERPARARSTSPVTSRVTLVLTSCLVSLALLGFATTQGEGLPSRYPEAFRSLLAPLTFGVDYSTVDESKNTGGPLLALWGESHAAHLYPGLHRLQNERTFRVTFVRWDNCPPVNDIPIDDQERCRVSSAAAMESLKLLRPDIVVIAGFWRQYNDLERISRSLAFLKQIDIHRVVVVGPVPNWPEPLPRMLYEAFKNVDFRRIPDRLMGFDKAVPVIERQLKEIATSFDVTYVSPYATLCNEQGCLVRLGESANDLVQVDLSHLSDAGSWFLASHVAHQIFD